MRDRIRSLIIARYQGVAEFQILPQHGYMLADNATTNILDIFQERLDEIKHIAYEQQEFAPSPINAPMNNIIALCTLTTEPTTPTLQVGNVVNYLGRPLGVVDAINDDGTIVVAIRGMTKNAGFDVDEPTLQVGQMWEKAPTHKCTIKFMHTSDEGVEQIVVENKGGHLVVMKPDTFGSYQLVKDGE